MEKMTAIPRQEDKSAWPENYRPKLKQAMSSIAEHAMLDTAEAFVSANGTINMNQFTDVYAQQSIDADAQRVSQSDRLWSGYDDEESRKNFISLYGYENESPESVRKRMEARRERMKEKGDDLEMLVTLILHKGFGPDYVVVRASLHDDYVNGLDTLIVNKKTGKVIGAFDEVHNDDLNRAAERKREKLLKKILSGGAKAKYGLTFERDKEGKMTMKKKQLEHLPIFYIGLTSDEMKEVLAEIDVDNLHRPNGTEQKAFNKMLVSLKSQADASLANEKVRGELRENLVAAAHSFAELMPQA